MMAPKTVSSVKSRDLYYDEKLHFKEKCKISLNETESTQDRVNDFFWVLRHENVFKSQNMFILVPFWGMKR